MTKQRRAALAAPNLFGISCDQCGRQLVPTASGFLACEKGHGKLVEDTSRQEQDDDDGKENLLF